jgi:hypothetical protein
VAIAALVASAAPAAAHSPDPFFGGALFAQDQHLIFKWRAGQVPPSWLRPAIVDAARDATSTRASKSASFAYNSGSPSTVGYGEPTGCGSGGIACFTRSAPTSFTMSFRRQGHVFDWGTLNWCQFDANWASGCFDAENIALDEFGHVEILNHHVNHSDGSDYLDAVVQTVSHANPRVGWNAHAFARCDIATLQIKYDMRTSSSPYSTCLDLVTILGVAPSASSVTAGTKVTFVASLQVGSDPSYERLRGNPLSSRRVVLQRSSLSGGSWITVTTMLQSGTSGTYTSSIAINASYQWRAVYPKIATEGLRASTSNVIVVRAT